MTFGPWDEGDAQAAPNAVLFGGKRTKDNEAEARAVAAKQQKLVENSAAIAAQPRRGATNAVPAAKATKATPAPRGNITTFFTRA